MALELGIKLSANTSGFTGAINSASKALSDTLAKSMMEAKVSLNQLDPAIQKAVQGIDLMNFDQVSAAMNKFVGDGNLLSGFLERLKGEMGGVDDNEAFTELSKVIKLAENQLKNLSNAENANASSSKSLKTQLREMREELAQMRLAGLQGTDAYKQLDAQAGQLQDTLQDASQSIKTLSSDTFAIDATVGIVQNVTSAFQVYQGVLALTGVNNEEAQKSLQKLMAVMSIAQGIQQLGNFLTEQSAAKKVLDTTVTYAQSVAYRVLGASMATATTATRVFATAIATTGIGALVIALSFAISKLVEFASRADKAKEAQDALRASLDQDLGRLQTQLSLYDKKAKLATATAKAEGASQSEIAKIEEDRLRKRLAAINRTLADERANGLENKKLIEDQANAELELQVFLAERVAGLRESLTKKNQEQLKQQESDQKDYDSKRLQKEVDLIKQLDSLKKSNLDFDISALESQIEERRAKEKEAGVSETNDFKELQNKLYVLKIQRINEEFNAERAKIAELGDLTVGKGKEALDKLTEIYDKKVLALNVELKPAANTNRGDIQNGILSLFGSQKFDNKAFTSSLGDAVKTTALEDVKKIQERDKLITDQLEQSRAVIESGLEDSITGAADAIGNVLANGGGIGQALAAAGQVILKTLGGIFQQLGKQLIAAAIIVKGMKEALKTLFANPIAGLVVGVGLVALGGILKNIKLLQATPFADGGIVMGPRLGLVGEAGKEAIIPLDRIGEVLGSIGGSQNVFVTGQLSGETIYLQQQRVSQRRGRFV